jgi:hypothetical protein
MSVSSATMRPSSVPDHGVLNGPMMAMATWAAEFLLDER